jgi:hypothetical protein
MPPGPRSALVAITLCVSAAAGCGGDAADTSTRGTGTRDATSDEERVAEVGQQYLNAIATQDYEAACETRIEEEQARFEQLAGSCPKAFKAITGRAVATLFRGAQVVDVRVVGNEATFNFAHPGQEPPDPDDPLHARKVGGEWRLYDPRS